LDVEEVGGEGQGDRRWAADKVGGAAGDVASGVSGWWSAGGVGGATWGRSRRTTR
jgi:hypothetical protein